MYLEFYGLTEPPFSLTPDTEFYFENPSHQEALNVLLVALESGEGFIKVTGEVGLGKTLLCRKLLNSLGDDWVTAYIPNPHLSPVAVRLALAEELGIPLRGRQTQEQVLREITRKLIELRAEGKRTVLLLDEAQQLPQAALEAVRLLTNLETEKSKLLQVVLFGQPELDERLDRPAIRQLRQRISFSYTLDPMTREHVGEYVRHRLRVAGYRGGPLFHERAVDLIYRTSHGIPRLINILCHKAMLAAFGRGDEQITPRHANMAIRDTEGVARARPMPRGLWYGLAAAVVVVLGLAWWLGEWR
ncbi:MAG: AAA family ATPase [Gammaproteobacteria bacterium]|jgi:MSHA biogenesis protein MshM